MKAKFVYESLTDIFKPKSEKEIDFLFNEAFQKYKKYIVKYTSTYAIFQFDIDTEEKLKEFWKFNVKWASKTPFAMPLDQARKYIEKYYEEFGPFILVIDKLESKFYLTQLKAPFVADMKNDRLLGELGNQVTGENFLKKYNF